MEKFKTLREAAAEDPVFQAKIIQRHKNYVEYYERIEPRKVYSLSQLLEMDLPTLLKLIPNNLCQDEYSENSGYCETKHLTGFQMHKVIDGSWHIGYYENHRDKIAKDQFCLFELLYVKDLKIGLIELFMKVQNKGEERFNSIKQGHMQISLDDSWDDRVRLKLDKK